MMNDITCDEAGNVMTRLHRNAISATEQELLRQHLWVCATCFEVFMMADEQCYVTTSIPTAISQSELVESIRRSRGLSTEYIANCLGITGEQAQQRKACGIFSDQEIALLLGLPVAAIRRLSRRGPALGVWYGEVAALACVGLGIEDNESMQAKWHAGIVRLVTLETEKSAA